jgi:outer membrane protein assembly factor BamB
LKPPFRLLWEKSGSGMMTCNGKLIICVTNGYELASLKTGEAYMTRQIDRDRTIECFEIDGRATVLMTRKSSLLAYDLEAGREIWKIGLSYEKYHNFLSHRDGDLLYIQLKNGVISALDMRDGKVHWEYDFLPGTDFFSNDRETGSQKQKSVDYLER